MHLDSLEDQDEAHCRRIGVVWGSPPAKRGAQLLAALVERPGSVIRRLAGGNRARQVQFARFLHNEAVTVAQMAATAAERTAELVARRDVLAIQDSSELIFGGKRARDRGFGAIGRGGGLGGLLLHAVLAVDATNGALLGLVGMQVNNRIGDKPAHRRQRTTAEKESQRWLDGMFSAAAVLGKAKRITVVADRESDIYEEFARRPANVHLITRVAQNRRIQSTEGPATLIEFAETLPERTRFEVTIPPAPGRAERSAVLALRFSQVVVCKPNHGTGDISDVVTLTLVDIKETSQPEAGDPIHWRLLTSHRVETPGAARMILDFYRRRWIIEDYFRTLKTAGFDIEASEIEDPDTMTRFVGAATCAAVKVLQLVRARDGNTDQMLTDSFDPADQPVLEALSRKLEGKTERQKNPHQKGTLAFAAWVIARLGSWDGYYGKPGPKVMRIGLQDFQMIKYGHHLEPRNV